MPIRGWRPFILSAEYYFTVWVYSSLVIRTVQGKRAASRLWQLGKTFLEPVV